MMKSGNFGSVLQNHLVVTVLLLIMGVPLLFGGPQAKRTEQVVAYGFLGLLLFVIWLLRLPASVDARSLRTFATTGPTPAILASLCWAAVTAAAGAFPAVSQFALIQFAAGALIYLVVVNEFREKQQIHALLFCLVSVALLVVLYAFATDLRHHVLDLTGSFHDRQLLGAFLELTLPIAMAVAAGCKPGRVKIGAQVSALLIGVALLMTRNRSSWLGIALAVAVFIVLSVSFAIQRKNIQRKKHELIVAPILTLVVIGMAVGFTRFGGQLTDRAQTFSAIRQDSSFEWRLNAWKTAWRVIRTRPLTGVGVGAYPLAQADPRINRESRPVSAILEEGPSLTESPHNSYLQIAAEQGFIGLLLHLAVLLLFFRSALQVLPQMKPGLRQYVLIGCLASLAGQCVDSVSNPGWLFPEVATFFWLVLGLGMCAAGLGKPLAPTPEQEEDESHPLMTPEWRLPPVVRQSARWVVITLAGAWVSSQLLGPYVIGVASAGQAHAVRPRAATATYDPGIDPGTAGRAAAGAGGMAGGAAAAAAGGMFGPLGAVSPLSFAAAFADCDECECVERYPGLPQGAQPVREIRVVPNRTEIWDGSCVCFHLEGYSEQYHQWFSLTDRPDSRLYIGDPAGALTQKTGKTHLFCVPAGTSMECDKRVATVVGIYQPAGRTPLRYEAKVQIRIHAARLAALPPDHSQIEDIRLYSNRDIICPECCVSLELEVKSARDHQWYNVTRDRRSSIYVEGDSSGVLEREKAAKNLFFALEEVAERHEVSDVTLVGSFAGDDHNALFARRVIHVSATGERLRTLPADQNRVTEVRLWTDKTAARIGCCLRAHLEGKSAKDGKWYSLTLRDETHLFSDINGDVFVARKNGAEAESAGQVSLEKEKPGSGKLDRYVPETKGRFCLRRSVEPERDGHKARIVGIFAPLPNANTTLAESGGQVTVSAAAASRFVRIAVPGAENFARARKNKGVQPDADPGPRATETAAGQ